MRRIGSTLVLLALLFGGTVRAQESNDVAQNIFAALAARDIPLQLQGKDLTAAWHVLRADETPVQTALMQMLGMPQTSRIPQGGAFAYTRGDVLAIGGQIYLIAYNRQLPRTDQERERKIQYLRAMRAESDEVALTEQSLPLEENTPLVLSLISLNSSKKRIGKTNLRRRQQSYRATSVLPLPSASPS